MGFLVSLIACSPDKERSYRLDATNSTGSGFYFEGDRVELTPVSPDSQFVFIRWLGDTSYLDEIVSFDNSNDMPGSDIELEAFFTDQPSFVKDVKPLVLMYCGNDGCHDQGSNETVLTNYDEIAGAGRRNCLPCEIWHNASRSPDGRMEAPNHP